MRRLILGTAGHIDHGKTALVRALTGVDTDRLPEEKRRGITIDLGFARLPLSDDLELGVVDVPGHEAFVRNMLAGATGFDLALLVVAADEGVMPQTREHLSIIELLGVRAGVVALTKTDLVDEEWLALVLEDVRSQLGATSFAGAPVIPVSAVTSAGLTDLRQAFVRAAESVRPRSDDDLFRMPVDRVFTVHGTGTVATGTVWSGSVRRDDALVLLPSGIAARARGVQVHSADVERATAGQRTAVALAGAGVDREHVARGEVLVQDPAWRPSTAVTARVRIVPGSDWELVQRQRIRFHLGTAEVLGRVRLFGADTLRPGEEGWARIALERPAVARAGDRFVIRSYSPVTTIGGGVVLEPDAALRKRLDDPDRELLEKLLGDPVEAVAARAELAGWAGAEEARLPVETPHPPSAVAGALRSLSGAGDLHPVGERVYAGRIVDAARKALLDAVDACHEHTPLRAGMDREELRRVLLGRAPSTHAATLADALLDGLVAEGVLETRGHVVARAGFVARLSDEQARARERIAALFDSAGLAPPSLDELPPDIRQRKDFWPLLKLLEAEGTLVPIAPELWISGRALDGARTAVRTELAGRGPLAPTDFRAIFPISRKHLIPLLEFLDREGVTVRKGNERYVPA